MHTTLLLSSGLLLFISAAPPLASGDPPRRAAAPPSVADLSWLEGTWHGRIGGRDFEAHYTGVDGEQILSASKYTENGKAAGFEFERFEQRGDTLLLTPFPEGKSSVSFPLSEYDGKTRRAVFENLSHDFPTRISYQRVAKDRLTILVSGPGEDGKEQVLTYALNRSK
ncbi:MAG TPA: DUF6265 family protein [Gemmatimonadales bacterium]|nr:DUF6265 family protein [Gemmatimonadales bacterium]